MTTTTHLNGRLGNQIIRNLAVSLIAKKYNLYVEYSSYELITQQLGIDLFIGNEQYDNIIELTDDNYFSVYENILLYSNLNPNNNYFQTKEITNFLYNYLHNNTVKQNIINKNPFNFRYNANNDLFVHIRLTDVAEFNPGINYYMKVISNINFENLFVSTDDVNHCIIHQIIEEYPNMNIICYDEIKTIQFGSTCKNIILSHGSFSAVLGYLSFFSNINYPEYESNKIWFGDMFSINGWNKIKV